MTPERVTVTISSSAGENEPLIVADAMRQLLDFFELLSSAGGSEAEAIDWQLVAISMNSPLKATAQAVSRSPGVIAAPIARREKAAVQYSLTQAMHSRASDWSNALVRSRSKSLFTRNTATIGRTSIQFEENIPPLTIVPAMAREVVSRIDQYEREQLRTVEDASRTEFGSIEAVVINLTTHYNHPALRVRERLTGDEVVCIVSPELAEEYGPQHNWSEVWSSKRLLLTGEIAFKADGRIGQIRLEDIEVIDPAPLSFSDIASPGFTGGLSPQAFLDAGWEASDA